MTRSLTTRIRFLIQVTALMSTSLSALNLKTAAAKDHRILPTQTAIAYEQLSKRYKKSATGSWKIIQTTATTGPLPRRKAHFPDHPGDEPGIALSAQSSGQPRCRQSDDRSYVYYHYYSEFHNALV